MNITLTDVLTRAAQGQSNQAGAAGNAASALAVAKQLHASAVLNSLVTGQTIGGQIRSMQSGQILLDIGNGVEINARLDGDIQTNVGRHMLFEVKANSNDKLMLSPLYTNLSAGKSAAMSALSAAGMSITGENVAMVNGMMEEGLPIDKASLWQMGKAAADFPNASADTVVRLTAMGMEINETNVMQYKATKNMQHQLLYAMEDITNGLPQALSLFQEKGKPLAGLQFMKDMLEVLQGKQKAQEGIQGEPVAEAAKGETPAGELLNKIDSLMKEIAGEKDGVFVEGKGNLPSETINEIASGTTNEIAGETINEITSGTKGDVPGEITGNLQGEIKGNVQGEITGNLPDEIKENVQGEVKENVQAEGKGNIPSGAVLREEAAAQQPAARDGAALLKDGAKLLEQGRTILPERLEKHLESLQKEFTKQIKNLLSEEWTIKPENFADKEEVKAFYQKIKSQSGQMQELFVAAGRANTTAGQAVQQVSQNLEFMHNLNQIFPYLQIPLKASLENAHGELYVYQRKKGKVSEDGSSSALLHLEMEHLGKLDIYVKMKDYNVSTQFTLASEEVLDFLSRHMHILDERLAKKGYHMQVEMKYKKEEQEENVISRIRGKDEKDTVVSYTAFDVRA